MLLPPAAAPVANTAAAAICSCQAARMHEQSPLKSTNTRPSPFMRLKSCTALSAGPRLCHAPTLVSAANRRPGAAATHVPCKGAAFLTAYAPEWPCLYSSHHNFDLYILFGVA